jgi:hypothetical protein
VRYDHVADQVAGAPNRRWRLPFRCRGSCHESAVAQPCVRHEQNLNMKSIYKASITAVLFGIAVTLFADGNKIASNPDVTASFLNYTNGGDLRFVVISFVNHEQVPIRWHDTYVEEDESSEHHAPIFNPNLPNWRKSLSLKSGGSEVIAVGTPSENWPAQMQWRVCRDYSLMGSANNYTVKSKWLTR